VTVVEPVEPVPPVPALPVPPVREPPVPPRGEVVVVEPLSTHGCVVVVPAADVVDVVGPPVLDEVTLGSTVVVVDVDDVDDVVGVDVVGVVVGPEPVLTGLVSGTLLHVPEPAPDPPRPGGSAVTTPFTAAFTAARPAAPVAALVPVRPLPDVVPVDGAFTVTAFWPSMRCSTLVTSSSTTEPLTDSVVASEPDVTCTGRSTLGAAFDAFEVCLREAITATAPVASTTTSAAAMAALRRVLGFRVAG
jgi:hypothetical protein